MHVDTNLLAALKTAITALNDPDLSGGQRQSHEHALLSFRREDAAWSTALSLVDQGQAHDLVLFASQTIRFKVNEQASRLPADQLPQLLQQLIHQLAKPHLHTQVLRQLCLATAALIALMPMWSDVVEVASQLPKSNGSELLTIIAEEGISDWRHVVIPGLSSSQQLDWAAATRERFRSWSHPVLQAVLCWLQECRQNSSANAALLVKLLSCLTAWVRLGALHHVPNSLAMQVAEAGLVCIQTRDEQEVQSSLNLLLEVPEYAPEQLLASLQPSMIEVAAAACRAANAPHPDLLHTAAWTRVFAVYAAALPQQLLQPVDAAGGDVQKALLHVSTLPHIHDGTLVGLPALEVWASLLDWDNTFLPASVPTSTAAASGCKVELERAQSEGETIGDLKQLPAAFIRSCLVLLLCTACNWLQWQQCSQGREAIAEQGTAAVVQDIMRMACNVLGPEKYVAAMMLVWGVRQQQQNSVAPHQQPHQGDHQHQQAASRAFLEAFQLPGCAPLLEQSDCELMPSWQQQQLSRALASIALSPACLRLQAAMLMAASSCAGRDAAAAVEAEGDPDIQWADTPAELQKCDFMGAGQLAQMLSAAAAALQHPASAGTPPEQQQQLALYFCVAVEGWARLLVELFISPATPDGAAHMSGLLQLLLNLAAHYEAAACSAAAAIRAVSSAALRLGWSQLQLFAPLLMQVAQMVVRFIGCMQALHAVTFVGGAEQDLLASLSSCLAAPGMGEQLQSLRRSVAQQLLQPGVVFLAGLQQQLQAGVPWACLASTADSQICHHLIRVRAVLEGRLLLQERQQKEQQRQQQLEQELEACAIGNSCEGIDRSLQALHVHDVGTAVVAKELAGRLAAAAMDDDSPEVAAPSLNNSTSSPGPDMGQQQSRAQEPQQQQGSKPSLWGAAGGSAAAAAASAGDPALQLLLTQVWPQLHSLVVHHNASGKFLHHYSKCCSRLLKIHPGLLVPQLQQFLQVTVVGIARPGGCSLGEPFAAAIEACCMQGSSLLLESGPQITQALSELWNMPELAGLQQPGGGDAMPDLAEQVLKLYSSFAKHGRVLHSHGAAAGILQQATAAAASCATCCHRKVGSTALSLLSAVLAAASCERPQQQQLLNVVCEQGVAIVQGVIGALLAPSPLSRVQKATAVLLDLAAAVDQTQHCDSGNGVVAAAAAAAQSTWQYQQQQVQLQLRSADEQQHCQIMYNWLLQGALKYVPRAVSQAEAAAVAADCAALLCGSSVKGGLGSGRQAQPASRSFIIVRKLKKRLRDFAEKHMRAAAGTPADHGGMV